MEPKKQYKAEKLLELLKAAGTAGILNSALAANPAIGWGFSFYVKQLRKAGHVIETAQVGRTKIYRTILVQAAPEPEPLPIFAAIRAAREGKRD